MTRLGVGPERRMSNRDRDIAHTGPPATLARGNRGNCTLTTPALPVQTAPSRAARPSGRLLLGAGAAASTGGRRRAAGVAGRNCLLSAIVQPRSSIHFSG